MNDPAPRTAPGNAAAVLAGLDPEQAAAVLAPLGPVRIIAGAGTGKTRTITHRIAHQALTGQVPGHQTLAVTHSSRAAGEMRDRIADLGVDGVQARTFHAAALRQLGYFWNHTGLPGPAPRLVSTVRGGRYGMLRNALATTLHVTNSGVDSTDVLDLDGEITWARARTLTPAQYPSAANAAHRTRTQPPDVLAAAYDAYENAKRSAALLDFDDLLTECATLIENDETVAARIRDQYRAFVVDEYQDTDPAQQRLLDAWVGDRDTLTVVGDPYQQIYSFKGAEATLLTGFDTRFPHTVQVTLNRDYRSTPQVVDTANRLMSFAAGPGPTLVLRGQLDDGPDPTVTRYDHEHAEEAGLVARVRDLLTDGIPASEIAVLHRFNAQAVRLESALRDAGIDVVGTDDAYFDRPEIVRALTGLAAAAARDPERPGPDALRDVLDAGGFDPDDPPPGEGAARARWEAQAALVDLADRVSGRTAPTTADLLTDLRRRAAEEHAPRRGGAVTVSTVHKAKGLEWDAVIVARLTEGSLPSVFATTTAQVEEERRLLYVAMTRARRFLDLSHARERGDGAGWRLTPSRFLARLETRPAGRVRGAAAPAPVPGRVFTPGQRVVHDTHGLGVVSSVAAGRVTINFGGSVGQRTVRCADPKLDTL